MNLRKRISSGVTFLLIIVGLFARAWNAWIFRPTDWVGSDPARHWRAATSLLENSPLFGIDPPGYQLWLGAIAKITLGDPLAIGIYAVLLSVFSVWPWYLLAGELFEDVVLRRWAWLCIIFLPDWVAIQSYYMIETILLPLIGTSLWLTLRAQRLGTTQAMLAATALWTATCLTKSSALPMAALSLMFLIWQMKQQRVKSGIMVAGLAVLICMPFAYRSRLILNNWSPFGFIAMNQIYWESGKRELHLEITRNRGSEKWSYLFISPSVDEEPLYPFSDWKTGRQGDLAISIDLDQGMQAWGQQLKKHYPGMKNIFKLWIENTIYLSVGNSWPLDHYERVWEKCAHWSRWLFPPLLLFNLIGAALLLKKNLRMPAITLLCLITWAAFILIPAAPMEGRYRMPLEGITIFSTICLWRAIPRELVADKK